MSQLSVNDAGYSTSDIGFFFKIKLVKMSKVLRVMGIYNKYITVTVDHYI